MHATLAPQRRSKPRLLGGFPTAHVGPRPRRAQRVASPVATHDFLVPNARPDLSTDPLMLAMLERP